MGRKALGERAMTAAERQKRYRDRRRAAAALPPDEMALRRVFGEANADVLLAYVHWRDYGYYHAGEALAEIHGRRLYRDLGYSRWEKFLKAVGITPREARRLERLYETAELIKSSRQPPSVSDEEPRNDIAAAA